jgi:hypothetical protein
LNRIRFIWRRKRAHYLQDIQNEKRFYDRNIASKVAITTHLKSSSKLTKTLSFNVMKYEEKTFENSIALIHNSYSSFDTRDGMSKDEDFTKKFFFWFESKFMFDVLYYFSVDTSLESKNSFYKVILYKNYLKRSFNSK